MTSKLGALDDLEALPLLGPEELASFGPTVIVAPHSDDESLGCGGLIALLQQAGTPVHVVVVSDGTASHARSRAYPAEARRDLRECEAIAAVAALGLGPDEVSFLRIPDSRVPYPDCEEFGDAVAACSALFASCAPQTVLVPWRRDPHTDHRATWHIVHAALDAQHRDCRLIEYPIWVWDLGGNGDLPEPGEMTGWRLDIASVLDSKLAAINAHRSQLTDLIHDDPEGFRLKPDTLARFQRTWEIYLEPEHG
jgi:LmbE family N-acetylglucosaminyl deacetylase